MTRRTLLPRPLLSAVLLGVWLLLANSMAFAHWLLGGALGIALPLLLHRLEPSPPRLRKPVVLLHFIAIVLWDIAIANLQVARLVLGPNKNLRPAFIELPLALHSEFAIAALASTITLTPGTVAAELSSDRRTLLIHALHVSDKSALIAQIKQRYEQPLREIFEC